MLALELLLLLDEDADLVTVLMVVAEELDEEDEVLVTDETVLDDEEDEAVVEGATEDEELEDEVVETTLLEDEELDEEVVETALLDDEETAFPERTPDRTF